MDKKSSVLLALMFAAFLVFTLFNETLLGGYRLDLTEGSLYTLSTGSREIIEDIDEPINFYYFFSESASRDLNSLRGYADQVEDLLREFELQARGKINLRVIDPAPFSEDEDLAASFGLQSVPVNSAGEELYFGLAATNALDDQVVIPFFQPDKEAFLEYSISRTIQRLVQVEPPVVALMSSIKVEGDINMQTFQSTPAWTFVEELKQRYEVVSLEASATDIPDEASLLILIHPKQLSEATRYAIDQFAMAGGRLLVFVDPLAEMDRPAAANPMMGNAMPGEPSALPDLLSSWGLTFESEQVVADAETALSVGGANGMPIRHFTILGLARDHFSDSDVIISGLESINLSSAGVLKALDAGSSPQVEPLMQVGPYASLVNRARVQMLSDPEELQQDFDPSGETYVLAARVTGEANSAFTGSGVADEDHIATTSSLNVIVVADTDLLTDRLWVQVQNFFGQRIASPFAGNGDFVLNAVDNLAGSSSLINIRNRGRYSRPFEVVQDLRREAEARYLESANELQAELLETETRLAELTAGQSDDSPFSISPEQEAELLKFQEDKLRIRKQLREVRHQLDKDIEGLGTTLKFLNILLVPILLILMLMMVNYVRLRGATSEVRD